MTPDDHRNEDWPKVVHAQRDGVSCADERPPVEAWLAIGDSNVTDHELAADLVTHLLGSPRPIEPGAFPGAWLIHLSDAESAELDRDGCLLRTHGASELTIETP